MAPEISVVIPTFNRTATLGRAVRSVLRQTYRDFELLVVDDASSDGTDVEKLWAETDIERYCVRREVNSGVAAARNAGTGRARGTWLAFLDSDDEWHPRKLEKQVAWIHKNPSYRIVQAREIWIRNGVRVNPPKTHNKIHGDIFAESLQRCMITPSSVLMQKSLFLQMGGFNESLPACEDYDLWLRVACRYPVGLVDEYLLTRYGGHADQLSRTVPVLDRFRIRALLDILESTWLNDKQRKLTRAMIARRAAVLANGYRKKGKVAEYARYDEIARRYE